MKNWMNEFKAFILRGNVLDMAVGVIVGGAFGKISTSLVNDVIMPVVGMLLGRVNFTDLKLILQEATMENGMEIPEVSVNYGNFIQQVVDFLIISAAVFVMIKVFNHLTTSRKKKEEEEAKVDPKPAEPTSEQLLMEIRDLLKEKQ